MSFFPLKSLLLFSQLNGAVSVCVCMLCCVAADDGCQGCSPDLEKIKKKSSSSSPFALLHFFNAPRFISWIFFPIYVVPLLLIFPSRTRSLRSHALALFEKRRVSASRHRAVWRYTYHIPCSDSILELLLLFSF